MLQAFAPSFIERTNDLQGHHPCHYHHSFLVSPIPSTTFWCLGGPFIPMQLHGHHCEPVQGDSNRQKETAVPTMLQKAINNLRPCAQSFCTWQYILQLALSSHALLFCKSSTCSHWCISDDCYYSSKACMFHGGASITLWNYVDTEENSERTNGHWPWKQMKHPCGTKWAGSQASVMAMASLPFNISTAKPYGCFRAWATGTDSRPMNTCGIRPLRDLVKNSKKITATTTHYSSSQCFFSIHRKGTGEGWEVSARKASLLAVGCRLLESCVWLHCAALPSFFFVFS